MIGRSICDEFIADVGTENALETSESNMIVLDPLEMFTSITGQLVVTLSRYQISILNIFITAT